MEPFKPIKIVGMDYLNVAREVTSEDKVMCKHCKKNVKISLSITFSNLKKTLEEDKSDKINIKTKGYCKECKELLDEECIIPLERDIALEWYKKLEILSEKVRKIN